MTARATPNPGEAVGEDATRQEAVEFARDHRGQLAATTAKLVDEGGAMLSHRAMQGAQLDVTRAVGRR